MNDELMQRLAGAAASMSVEEIADAIMGSRHGATVNDPMAVAAYIKKHG